MHLVIAPPPSGAGFVRQRMVKSGDQSAPRYAAGVTLSGWVSDASAPAVIVADGMLVSGGGTATLTGELRSNAVVGSAPVLWEVRLDGTAVASGSVSTTVAAIGPTTITVADGERATVWVRTSGIVARTVQDGTWIDIAPA